MQCPLEMFEFLIDGDSQSLEDSRRRVLAGGLSRPWGNRLFDQFGKLFGRPDGGGSTRFDKCRRDAIGESLLTILLENRPQLVQRTLGEIFGCRNSLTRVKPQIEVSTDAKAESAVAIRQLIRG